MKILVLYSHPNPASFNHAIREVVEKEIAALGHEIKVRDLYNLNFDPVLSASDLETIHKGGRPDVVKKEQGYVEWADIMVVIHPIWWAGLPAILKGYFDRVFAFGFAYTYDEQGPKGLLVGKKTLVINTTGTPYDDYHKSGMHEALKKTSDKGIYNFFGMEVIDHIFLGAVPRVSDEERKKYLSDVSGKIKKYFS